jgi:hypothetical protein
MGSPGRVRLACSAVRKANTARARLTEANFSAVTASATGDSTETSATCCAKPKCADGKCCIAVARVGRRPSPRLVGVLICQPEPAPGPLACRAGPGRAVFIFFPACRARPGQARLQPPHQLRPSASDSAAAPTRRHGPRRRPAARAISLTSV